MIAFMQINIIISVNIFIQQLNEKSKGHTRTPAPRSGQYLAHAHSRITRPVAAMDSCFMFVK